jgi:hypothetical protein
MIFKKLIVYLGALGLFVVELIALNQLGRSSIENSMLHFAVTLTGAFVVSHWVENSAAKS